MTKSEVVYAEKRNNKEKTYASMISLDLEPPYPIDIDIATNSYSIWYVAP